MGAQRKPIEHGTIRGYRSHLRNDVPVCIACRIAWNSYYRKYNAEGKKRGTQNQ